MMIHKCEKCGQSRKMWSMSLKVEPDGTRRAVGHWYCERCQNIISDEPPQKVDDDEHKHSSLD